MQLVSLYLDCDKLFQVYFHTVIRVKLVKLCHIAKVLCILLVTQIIRLKLLQVTQREVLYTFFFLPIFYSLDFETFWRVADIRLTIGYT